MTALTLKQQAFVTEYLRCFNATRAAIAAGYAEAGASVRGSELLANRKVSEAIEAEMKANAMSAAEVLYHLTAIARGDIADVVDRNFNPDLATARGNNATMLIKRVKQKAITSEDSDISETEVEMYDRLKALELLAKYHDLINKVRVEDWRSQAIADIRAGAITFDALSEAFSGDLATELFSAAGVPVR